MKHSSIPMLCSLALVAMCTAGVSHWYSIREFAIAIESNVPLIPLSAPFTPAPPPTQPAAPARSLLAENKPTKQPLTDAPAPQKEFFEALIKEVKTLRTENLNLGDQMAETNRDLMKLEFRVDTHSESFRPLPTSELRQDTTFQDSGFQDPTFDDGPGVLPPRAELILPSSDE